MYGRMQLRSLTPNKPLEYYPMLRAPINIENIPLFDPTTEMLMNVSGTLIKPSRLYNLSVTENEIEFHYDNNKRAKINLAEPLVVNKTAKYLIVLQGKLAFHICSLANINENECIGVDGMLHTLQQKNFI